MPIPHVVVLTGALAALLCLPCALAAVLRADQLAIRRGLPRRGPRSIRRAWPRRSPRQIRRPRDVRPHREICQLHSVDHELTINPALPPAPGPLPCIDQIAAELQRLDRQRRSGPTTESTVWLAAVLLAYDEWLRLACRSLGLVEHLQPLEGMDRDIERVRVEGELQANGLPLHRRRP